MLPDAGTLVVPLARDSSEGHQCFELSLPTTLQLMAQQSLANPETLVGLVRDAAEGLAELHYLDLAHGRLGLPSSVVVACVGPSRFRAFITDYGVPMH